MDFSRITHGPLLDALASAQRVDLSPTARSGLLAFAELVHRWGARTDLVSARDPKSLIELLVLDALVLARPEVVAGGRLVDVGAGAGAPSIPLALLRPDLDLTLVEPRRRRVAFLRTAIGSLGLASRVRAIEGRIDLARPAVVGGPFDAALSRATFAPDVWVGVGLALAPRVLVLTAASEPPAPPPGAQRLRSVDYTVPSTAAPRAVTVFLRSEP